MAKPLVKKFVKVTGILLGSLIILLTAFHFWFVSHIEDIIQNLVLDKSNGKLMLQVDNVKFRWFSNKMELQNAVFFTTDSTRANTTYRFAIKEIKLKVNSVFPVIFEKKVLIDQLLLTQPEIVVTRLRLNRDNENENKVSIPLEAGRIYNSIQDALKVLKVKKFQIGDGTFTLINKIQPELVPVRIGHIDFQIDNLEVDTVSFQKKEKLFFSDNISLKSANQQILFPDGRHQLSYSNFRINIEKKFVEFDSCTIAALKTDSTSTGFSIYFDALQMTNIDFNTLYTSQIIKADSVYCVNPQFNLLVDLDKRKSRGTKAPKLDEIIRQLTGDLLLNVVTVNNASFDINTIKNGEPSSFTSNKNNFDIQGLRVDNEAKKPVQIEKFVMAIRNYENFLKDSLYALQFDSILINNDKIFLNNFSFKQQLGKKTVNSFKVPIFQLTGLSLDDLLFEQKLTAQKAVLFNPVINYTEAPKKITGKKRRNLFDALADINQVIMLEDLNIKDGNIDMKLNGGIKMQLRDATVSVQSRSLLGSSQLSGIRRSVNDLVFKSGDFSINDISVHMDSVNYTGTDSRFLAGRVIVKNDATSLVADAGMVRMNEIFINEATGDVTIGGINWQKAKINLDNLSYKGKGNGRAFINLTDITGSNTDISYKKDDKTIAGFVNKLSAIAFLLKPGELPLIAGLNFIGNHLSVIDSSSNLSVKNFSVTDLQTARLDNIQYHYKKSKDTAFAKIPLISFVPDIQTIISGEIKTGELTIKNPMISVFKDQQNNITTNKGLTLPKGTITKLTIEEPNFHFTNLSEKGIQAVSWNGNKTKDNRLVLTNVSSNQSLLSANQLDINASSVVLKNKKGKIIDAGNGIITAQLNDLRFTTGHDSMQSWSTTLTTLRATNFKIDSVGKNKGIINIENVILNNLSANNSNSKNVRQLMNANQSYTLNNITGRYTDNDNTMYLLGGRFEKSTNTFTTDSFLYSPTSDLASFLKNKVHQADYIKLKTGKIEITDINPDRILQDSVLKFGTFSVNQASFVDYRDNSLPLETGSVKPLLSGRIKTIPFKLTGDSLIINDAFVSYTEKSPLTNQEGAITVNRLNIVFSPILNTTITEKDSLSIMASGYLYDSIGVRLQLKESYIDSLAGLLMTVAIKPTDLRLLNQVLVPLAAAKIKTGYLDSLFMQIAGNEYAGVGKMEMFYHNLKVQILRSGGKERKKLVTGLINFLANSFVVKNKNAKKSSPVFFVRNRERSSLNFLIKLVMNGATNTIGMKEKKKKLKASKNKLEEQNQLPFFSQQ